MRSRGLVVAIAVVLAVLAAVGVIVYTNQVRDEVTTENTVPVLVANQDIPTNSELNPLLDAGVFESVRVPTDALVADAVTSEDQLRDEVTSAPIFAREQIPLIRLSSGDATLSLIGVSDDHIGLTIELEAPRGGGGIVQRGDNVAIFATFGRNTPVTRESLGDLLSPGQIQQFFGSLLEASGGSVSDADVFMMPFDFTLTLVPTVSVLGIQNPVVDEQGRSTGGGIQMTLDMLPEDARNLVFASETATLWVGLLPPANADEGYPIDAQIGADYDDVVGIVEK